MANLTPLHTHTPIPHHHAYIPLHSHFRPIETDCRLARVFVITYMLRVTNADSKKKKKKNAWVRTTMYCHILNQKLDFVVEIIRAIIIVGVETHTYRDVLRHATDSQ